MSSDESILGDYIVGCLKILGLVVFFLVCVVTTVIAEPKGKTDGCLVTLYNYPAETPRYDVSEKNLPQSPLPPKKELRASKSDEKIHSQLNLASQGHSE